MQPPSESSSERFAAKGSSTDEHSLMDVGDGSYAIKARFLALTESSHHPERFLLPALASFARHAYALK